MDTVNTKEGSVTYLKAEGNTVKNSSKFNVQSSKVNTQSNNTKEISIPIETEGEMESVDGKSKIKTRINKIRINEDVKFEWLKPVKNVQSK
ncbi:MAG: hypothetical protein KA120_08855 [Candidatus Goldbacteria bacterium]|nr:hypothetical protein [Candidatus Goldiibacteriota bacterium]